VDISQSLFRVLSKILFEDFIEMRNLRIQFWKLVSEGTAILFINNIVLIINIDIL